MKIIEYFKVKKHRNMIAYICATISVILAFTAVKIIEIDQEYILTLIYTMQIICIICLIIAFIMFTWNFIEKTINKAESKHSK